ncbi:MAG TPA: BON domain-containing protein [Verrucomicrobiae bacterium]
MKTDLQLKEEVLSRLELEPKIDPAGLGVSVEDGVVTLRGSLESEDDRASTERVVRFVEGVKGVVDDDLRVKCAPCARPSDSELQARAREAIQWLTTVSPEKLGIGVRDGWLTLEGEIESLHQAQSVEAVLRDIDGVRGVKNALKVIAQPVVA